MKIFANAQILNKYSRHLVTLSAWSCLPSTPTIQFEADNLCIKIICFTECSSQTIIMFIIASVTGWVDHFSIFGHLK